MSDKVSIDGRLNGSKTIQEAMLALSNLGRELESLAGRGYALRSPIENGEAMLSKPDTYAMTDRERLSAAFLELERDYGYAAPISLSWEADCLHHALMALVEKYPEERPGAAFWFSSKDDEAFGYRGYSSYMKEEYDNLPDDEGVRTGWVQDHQKQIESSEISERLQHNVLVRPLWIYWSGDPDVIIGVLKKQGLTVDDEVEEGDCINVYPFGYRGEE